MAQVLCVVSFHPIRLLLEGEFVFVSSHGGSHVVRPERANFLFFRMDVRHELRSSPSLRVRRTSSLAYYFGAVLGRRYFPYVIFNPDDLVNVRTSLVVRMEDAVYRRRTGSAIVDAFTRLVGSEADFFIAVRLGRSLDFPRRSFDVAGLLRVRQVAICGSAVTANEGRLFGEFRVAVVAKTSKDLFLMRRVQVVFVEVSQSDHHVARAEIGTVFVRVLFRSSFRFHVIGHVRRERSIYANSRNVYRVGTRLVRIAA